MPDVVHFVRPASLQSLCARPPAALAIGDKPVARLEAAHIAAIMAAKAKAPTAANNLHKIHLLGHAITLGMITSNPTKLVKKFKIKGDGWRTWSEDEVTQYLQRHPAGSKAHLALMPMLYTGQRRSDVMGMGWQHICQTEKGPKIAVRQKKFLALGFALFAAPAAVMYPQAAIADWWRLH